MQTTIITKDQNCELRVEAGLMPGTRIVSILCDEYIEGILTEQNTVTLLTRGEVEGVIKALQDTLDIWDDWNGLS